MARVGATALLFAFLRSREQLWAENCKMQHFSDLPVRQNAGTGGHEGVVNPVLSASAA